MAFFSDACKGNLFVHINSSAFESMVEFADLLQFLKTRVSHGNL